MIDGIDLEILKMLQFNARVSNAEIARQVDLAPSAVFERIRKLEERGVIEGYSARISPAAVELPLLAFIFVRDTDGSGTEQPARRVAEIPGVLEVHHVAGEDCFLAKVRARDTESLSRLLREIGRIPSVTSTRTTIVLDTEKEGSHLPIEAPAPTPESVRV